MVEKKKSMIKVNGMQGVVIMAVFRQWDNLNEKLIIVFLHLLRTEELGESIMQRVTYSLKVLLAEFEKLLFLILLFGILDCLPEFFIVFWNSYFYGWKSQKNHVRASFSIYSYLV